MIHVVLFGIEAGLGAALTYLVHSTLWIVGATLLTRFHRGLSPSAAHVVWRAALCGPLVSSAFALGLGHRWEWTLVGASAPSAPAEVWASPSVHPVPLRPLAFDAPFEFVRAAALEAAPGVRSPGLLSGSAALALAWGLVALGGLLLLARAVYRQRGALGRRTPVLDAVSSTTLARLAQRAGIRHPIRLTSSARASSPLVLSQQEICLPARVRELDPSALEAVLAHELAHIERRDGYWLHGSLVLQALLWFQPLNRKARAELQESAELAADDRAIELTGDALGLARTLTQVAGWVSVADRAPSVAMARAGSPIVERVARLVAASDTQVRRAPRRMPWFALTALTAIGACSPSVGAPQAPLPRPRPVSVSMPAPAPQLVPVVVPAGSGPFRSLPLAPVEPAPAPAVPAPAAVMPAPAAPAAEVPAPAAEVPARTARTRAPARRAVQRPKLAEPIAPALARSDEWVAAPLPSFDALSSEVVGDVVPQALAFSQRVTELASSEFGLRQRIQLAQLNLAAGAGSARAASLELARLQRELGATTARRELVERDFAASMQRWGERLQRGFDVSYALRGFAGGGDVAFQMRVMSSRLDREMQAFASNGEAR